MPISIQGVELKRYVLPLTTNFSSFNTTGTSVDLLALVTQGAAYYQRIGRVIRLRRITVRGLLHGGQVNAISDDPYNEARCMIIQANSGTTINSSVVSLNLPPDSRTFPGLRSVKADRRVSLMTPARDSTGYIPAVCPVSMVAHFNEVVAYSGDGVAPCARSTCYLFCISDSGFVAHPGFVSGYVTVEFTDQ